MGRSSKRERTTPAAPKATPPALDAAYLKRIAAIEAAPENQSGADKTWVARLVATSARHFEQAVRVR
jgi:hypothetical protein